MKDKKPIQFDFNDREEINHRFQGNIIGYVKDDGEVLPFRLMRARNSGFEGELFTKGKYKVEVLKVDHTAFAWSFPELGYVNVDNVCVFLSRKAGRYYTRGFNERHVSSTFSFRGELRELGAGKRYNDSGNAKVMYSLMNREFDDFHTALNQVIDGDYLARAFNKEWCVGVKRFSEYPVIFYKDNMVGYFADGAAKIAKNSSFLKESLSVHTPVVIVPDFKEMYI